MRAKTFIKAAALLSGIGTVGYGYSHNFNPQKHNPSSPFHFPFTTPSFFKYLPALYSNIHCAERTPLFQNFPFQSYNDPELESAIEDILGSYQTSCSIHNQPNPKNKELLIKINEHYPKLLELVHSEKWKENSKSKHFVSYTFKDNQGKTCLMSVGVIPFTPIEVFAFITGKHYKWKPEYDKLFNKATFIEDLGSNTKIYHHQYNPVWPCDRRDFIFLSQNRLSQEDGNIISYTISIEDERVPKLKGHVRAHCNIGAWILEKTPENHTRATFIYSVDLCGSIPQTVQNYVNQKQGEVVGKVKVAMMNKYNVPDPIDVQKQEQKERKEAEKQEIERKVKEQKENKKKEKAEKKKAKKEKEKAKKEKNKKKDKKDKKDKKKKKDKKDKKEKKDKKKKKDKKDKKNGKSGEEKNEE